jgi:membrane-associated progesterone receptor component
VFAGRDASRGLGTFNSSADAVKDTYDDLSDLTATEVEGMKEWADQFSGKFYFLIPLYCYFLNWFVVLEKYPIVGRLLKPGDVPETYSDAEEEEGEYNNGSMSGSMTASTASSIDSENKKSE